MDFNNNGVLDVQNIFPFAIRREVTLLGTRTTADHLEGTYTEAILGALPNNQRIYMTGTFSLDRDTLTPTTTSIYNGQTNTTVIIGGSSQTSYTNSFYVGPSVQINGVTVNMNFNFPTRRNWTWSFTPRPHELLRLRHKRRRPDFLRADQFQQHQRPGRLGPGSQLESFHGRAWLFQRLGA